MNWKTHIEKLKSKLSRFAYALYELKVSTDKKTAITAYYAYAHSWLNYGLILWGNGTNIEDLLIKQKKLIRIIVNINNTDSRKPYLVQLKILTIISMYILELCKFVRKNPNIFKDTKPNRVYGPRMNQKNQLAQPKSRINMYKNSPYVNAIKVYNHLPNEIRGESNTNKFINKIKTLLIEKCYYNLTEYYNDKFT